MMFLHGDLAGQQSIEKSASHFDKNHVAREMKSGFANLTFVNDKHGCGLDIARLSVRRSDHSHG